MTAVRMIVQMNNPGLDERLAGVLENERAVRQEPDCLQFEHFRSIEVPDHMLILELWESGAAFDRHQAQARERGVTARLAAQVAPYHNGTIAAPRRHGQNGVEIYRHAYVTRFEGAFALADPAERAESVRWPAAGPIRILIQATSDPATADVAAQVQGSVETRAEVGCLQFEHFRGLENPENTALVELWTTPEIYDLHWFGRLRQQAARGGAPAPGPTPTERHYGQPGLEWYAHSYYTLVGDVWMPEDPAARMISVRW